MSNTLLHNTTTNYLISAAPVNDDRRSAVLPYYFPNSFLLVERAVYGFSDKLCQKYNGGFWEFYELSNGGFYMSPRQPETVEVSAPFGNGYDGTMSADAFGIVACLFAYSYLAEQHPESNFGDFYWNLRDFMGNHLEASAIYAAID